MNSQSLSNVILPFIVIAFFLYRRVKRSIGFQKFSPKRMTFRIILFSLIGFIILMFGVLHPILFLADVVGIAVGAVLAYYLIYYSFLIRKGNQLFADKGRY
jgi:hypothetical protein